MSSMFASVSLLVAVAISTTSATLPTLAVQLPALPSALAISTGGISLPALSLPAFGTTTFTVGTTAFVAGSGGTALGAAAIAGLAIAKSALLLATIRDANARPKREAAELDFSQMFDGIDRQDASDCGKLLVCQSFAKADDQLTGEEKAIISLFDDLSIIQSSAYGKFQWAAYAGTFKNPTVCLERYSRCQVKPEVLSNLINVQ